MCGDESGKEGHYSDNEYNCKCDQEVQDPEVDPDGDYIL